MRSPISLALSAFIGMSSLVAGQTPQKDLIVFPRVEPKLASPPEGAAQHWVITGMPTESDVHVADAGAARAIADWLAAHAGVAHEWLLDKGTSWSLPELMSADLGSRYIISRGSGLFLGVPKTTDQAREHVEFAIRLKLVPPRPGIAAMTIRVTTEALENARQAARKVKAPEPAGVPLLLGQLATGVTGIGAALPEEVAKPEDAAALKGALRGVAEQAWAVSVAHGMVLGAKPDDPGFADRGRVAANELHELYSIGGRGFEALGWPPPKLPTYEQDDDPAAWILFIEGVRMAREIRLEVPLTKVDEQHGDAEQIQRRRDRARQLKKDTEAKAGARLKQKLDSLHNTVPTGTSMRAVLGAVEADPSLRPPGSAVAEGQTIRFIAGDNQPRFGFDTTVEAGWSAENRLIGKGTFAGDNLFRLSDARRNRVDSESLSFAGGPDVQQFNGSWQLAMSKELKQGATLRSTIGFDAQVRLDRNQVFGNPKGTRLSLNSRRVGPEYTFEYTSPLTTATDEPRKFVLGWTSIFRTGPGFGRVAREEGFAEGVGTIAEGTYFGFELEEEVQMTWRLRAVERKGIGQVRGDFRVRGREVPAWLDFGFRDASASAEAEVKFGFEQSRDWLARYRLGMMAASSGTPLFELPRLGGGDTVRGLEEGELIGRKLGYAQLSIGPSIESAVTWFGKKRPKGARLGPIALADTYVTFTYDRGGALERGRLTDLLAPSAVSAYGAQVELQNFSVGSKRGRLSIGYGYSPDSARHSHGIVVTALAIDLN